ncbi:MAG: hypothetical protein ACJAX3_001926, partial [Patiriisocius sp.]
MLLIIITPDEIEAIIEIGLRYNSAEKKQNHSAIFDNGIIRKRA